MDTNILVQYDGGGYSGCVWEWNFFYIDKDGKFENIFSSGCGGIENQKDAENLVENNGSDFSSKIYIYHLDNENELAELARELNVQLLKMLIEWFNEYNIPNVQPYAICEDCRSKFENPDDIILRDSELFCYECSYMKSCSYCGEYVGDDNDELITTVEQVNDRWDLPAGIAENIVDNYSPVCVDCAGGLMGRELDKLIEKTKGG